MSIFRTVTTIVAIIALLNAHAVRAQIEPARMDALAQRSLEVWPTPGLAVAVVEDGEIRARGYGFQGNERRDKVNEDTLFAIGSCTKSMAAATVASLVDAKKLAWEDRVTTHLEWFRAQDPWVTRALRVRDLVSHRAGLRAAMPRAAAKDRRAYLRSIAIAEPLHPFRYEFGYVNDMFTLAGELVATVAGVSWQDFAKQRFWSPLGMTRTNADFRVARRDANAASPTLIMTDGVVSVPWIYEDWTALPSGGVNSSAHDMALWMRFQLSDGAVDGQQLLSAASMAEMHSPQTVLRGPFAELQKGLSNAVGHDEDGIRFESYGMGWYVHDFRGHTILYHLGAIPGFRCVIGMAPEKEFGVAILVNGNASFQPIALFQDLLEERLGMADRNWTKVAVEVDRKKRAERARARVAKEAQRIPNAPASLPLDAYAGEYARNGDGEVLRIRADPERLVVSYGRLSYEARHWHGDTFRLTPISWRVHDEVVPWPYPTNEEPLSFLSFILDGAGSVREAQTEFGRFFARPRRSSDSGDDSSQ